MFEKDRKNCMNFLLNEKEREIIIDVPKIFHSNQQSQCNLHKFLHCSVISSVISSVIFSVIFHGTYSVMSTKLISFSLADNVKVHVQFFC